MANNAVKIGADATRMPASEEAMWRSPWLISRNGPATWIAARTNTCTGLLQTFASPPERYANGSSTSDASAVREKTTPAGERSSSPILMNRYDAPQSAASTSSRIQLRRSTHDLVADGGGRPLNGCLDQPTAALMGPSRSPRSAAAAAIAGI